MGVPTRLGRYAVRRRLGSGGFATVWLAYDEQLDAEVAIKLLAENWADDDSVRRRFVEEGRFLRRVESEHVVQVHDVGELDDGRPFLVLTYADRGTLADRLKDRPLDLAESVDVVVQVGRGLQALHRRGLLHRDVKPANVLFRSTDDGERAVLSDLGLGKSLDEVSRITMPGGTPSYVAPEQAMGERLDARADQYSLGAVAYAALTGRSPHHLDGLGAAGRVSLPPPPSELGAAVPDRIDEAILRALEPDRDRRWDDVETFSRELVGGLNETTRSFPPVLERGEGAPDQAVTVLAGPASAADLSEPTVAATPRASSPRRRRRVPWVVAGILAALLGAAAGFFGQRYLTADRLVPIGTAEIAISVPRDWDDVSTSGWTPPGASARLPAVRASAGAGWGQEDSAVPGAFAGLMSGSSLPAVPTHKDCERPDPGRDTSHVDARQAVTHWSEGCRRGTVVVDRFVQLDGDTLLWAQVRAADRAAATRVLDTIGPSAG